MRKYRSRCRVCKQPWIPDARHVDTDGRVYDCIMDDNLEYLELLYDKKEKLNEQI
jgi:hypothetical protein